MHNRENLKQQLRIFPNIQIYQSKNRFTSGGFGKLTSKDTPTIILDCTNFQGIFEGQGIQLAKIIEKISKESDVIIGMCPPFPFLVKNHETFDFPFFSQIYFHTKNQTKYFHDSIEFLKSLGTKGIIINDDSMPLNELERHIRNSRTHRLFTLVYSQNVAISAALSKLDPNAIVFVSPQEIPNETPLSKIPQEIIENHVKRVNIENSKVFVYSGLGIFGKVDIEKALELQVDGFVLEMPYASLKDPYEFLKNIVGPLRNK